MFLRLAKHDCLKEWLERPWGRDRSKRKFSSEMLHARAWTIPLTPSMFRKSIKPVICLERRAWRDELSWESLWWHEIDSRSSRLRIECTCLHEQLYILHNDECRVAPRIFHTPTNRPRSIHGRGLQRITRRVKVPMLRKSEAGPNLSLSCVTELSSPVEEGPTWQPLRISQWGSGKISR